MPLFRRFKLGAVLGYLAAGVIIGPWGLKFITAVDNILHFAELGVVLLLFVIGLGLAMSSTAFVLQILAEKGQLTARHGRSSFAILLFQDLAVIPLLALIPLLGAGDAHTVAGSAWLGALKAIGVIIAVIAGGRYLLRPVLQVIAASGIQEIFTAAALRQPALLWRRCTPRSAARRRCRHGRDPGAGDRRRGSFVAYCRKRSQASSTRTVTGTISAGGTRRYSGRATFADASDW